jgi:hypothetical protein
MVKLNHEDRVKHSQLIRSFLYECVKQKERWPWETIIWSNRWPELCDFLCDLKSDYGTTNQEYVLIINQFNEVQKSFDWMRQAYSNYSIKNASSYNFNKTPSLSLKNKMRPHLTFFGILIAILFLGVITNNGQIGSFLGRLTGASLDPLIIIGGIIVGVTARNQFILFLGAILVEIIALVLVLNFKNSIGASYSIFSSVTMYIAILAWAYFSNFFVQLKRH